MKTLTLIGAFVVGAAALAYLNLALVAPVVARLDALSR